MINTESPTVLWAEDDAEHAAFACSLLQNHGMKVTQVQNVHSLRTALVAGTFPVVVVDVSLPFPSSVDWMREIRKVDLDVGVVVLFRPGQEGLAEVFLDSGAWLAVEKPVVTHPFVDQMVRAIQLYAMARLRREMLSGTTPDWLHLGDRAALEQVFTQASRKLTIAFQPVISWAHRRVMGHEALLRSCDPYLPDPMSVLAVAEKLQRVDDIGRRVREKVAEQVLRAPANLIFVNLHPQELLDEDLYALTAPLSQFARRVVLGISEAMLPSSLFQLEKRTAALRAMGFRFALKNIQAGHVGMGAWVRLQPEFAFLDGTFVRGLPENKARQEQVRRLSSQLTLLGTQVIAAGIESLVQRDAVIASAVDWLQGFAFSPPQFDYCEPIVGELAES